MLISLRAAQTTDREAVFAVEQKSTPGLIYLPYVFDRFVSEDEFIVAEVEGQVVACGKFTNMPDGSAWLETLRVIPEMQGQGIGKRFYERFFEIARAKGVSRMRMYTGIHNHASKGLAELFGFSLAGTYRGLKRACAPVPGVDGASGFQPVHDPARAVNLLLGQRESWGDFIVFNRTWYAFNAAVAAHLAKQGMVYYDAQGENLAVVGARFMPHQAVHIGLLSGDVSACLDFVMRKAAQVGAAGISCLSPDCAAGFQARLAGSGFQPESSDFIVMEAHLPG